MTSIPHVMIDLETMGTRSDAAIVQIGAVEFDPLINLVGPPGAQATTLPFGGFEQSVSLQSSIIAGGTVDQSTIDWWRRAPATARLSIQTDTRPLVDVLHAFLRWFPPGEYTRVWAHGAAFDLPILENALRAFNLTPPWSYKYVRDTRTLFDFATASGWQFGSYIFGSLKWPQRLQGGWAKLGFLEPNRTIARPSKIFESLGPKDIGSFGGVSVENAIPARVNASRSNWTVAAASGTSGITIPQTKFTGYTLAEFTKSHWECGNPDKRLANCAARENDSASLAIHAKTSFPDCRDKDCVNDRDWSAVNSRHAVAFIIAAARSFAAAASFSSFAARSSAWEVCR